MVRSTVAHVDLEAVAHNFRLLDAHLRAPRPGRTRPPGVIAVVKANAYGHGAGPVARALEGAGATLLACADIEEGIVLRRAGVRAGILVFGALGVSEVDGVFEHDLTPTVSTPGAGRALEAAARRRGTRLRYHLKIDTGLNRLGLRHDNLARTLPGILASPHLELAGVFTHFATADDPDSPLMDIQRARFEQGWATLASLGARPPVRHAAGSAAILRDPRVWYDLVRPGLLLYGVAPARLEGVLALRPALSLTSRLVAVKGVRAGEGIGYGARDAADRPRTIGVVPAGYADGLDTRLGGRGAVLVRGQRVPIVGAVSMDMLTVDVTGLAVEPGDDVVIIGAAGEGPGEAIGVAEMAARIGTIPYEVLCRLGTRIERVYDRVNPPRP